MNSLLQTIAQLMVGKESEATQNKNTDHDKYRLQEAALFSKVAGVAMIVAGIVISLLGIGSVLAGTAGSGFIIFLAVAIGSAIGFSGYEIFQIGVNLFSQVQAASKYVDAIRKGDLDDQLYGFWETITAKTILLQDLLVYLHGKKAGEAKKA